MKPNRHCHCYRDSMEAAERRHFSQVAWVSAKFLRFFSCRRVCLHGVIDTIKTTNEGLSKLPSHKSRQRPPLRLWPRFRIGNDAGVLPSTQGKTTRDQNQKRNGSEPLGDAVFLALVIWIFFTSPGWLKVLWVTSFTCVAAVRIWRYRKYLAFHWRKLISH